MSGLPKSLQSMTIRDILFGSIRLYKTNFVGFIGVILLVKGPYQILAYVLSRLLVSIFTEMLSLPEEGLNNIEPVSVILIVKFLELLFIPFISPIAISAMTIFISEQFLNRDIGVTQAYKRITERLLPLLGTVLLSGAFMSSGFILGLLLWNVASQMAGTIFIFAPFLASILWVWYAFIPQTVVIEGEGGIGAMKRSKYLVRGYFRKVFVLLVLVFLATWLVTTIVSYAVGKLSFFFGQTGILLGEGASNIISVLLEPFRVAIIPLLYYDLRVRKEGFDLEIMAKELETE